MGITNGPYMRWKAYKHHQWMILTPKAILFLKHDREALNFLAHTGHTYIPDEFYFATVLLNSVLKDSVISCNKRYLRFQTWASHPTWLGWKDRYIFPDGEETPSFFFIRKFNAFGNVFQEQRLVKWIENSHKKSIKNTTCSTERASVDQVCLKTLCDKIAQDNHLIVVPVNSAMILSAANLLCSLKGLKMKNVIFWSMDVLIHDSLLSIGRLSLYLPGFPSLQESVQPGDKDYKSFLIARALILKRLIRLGYHVTLLDADSVVFQDFANSLKPSVDVAIGLLPPSRTNPMTLTSSFIHLSNSSRSRDFIDTLVEVSNTYSDQTFEWMFQRALQYMSYVKFSVPSGFMFQRKSSKLRNTEMLRNTTLSVQLMDPVIVMDGRPFLSPPMHVTTNFSAVSVLHTSRIKPPFLSLRRIGIWFIDDQGECTNSPNSDQGFSGILARTPSRLLDSIE